MRRAASANDRTRITDGWRTTGSRRTVVPGTMSPSPVVRKSIAWPRRTSSRDRPAVAVSTPPWNVSGRQMSASFTATSGDPPTHEALDEWEQRAACRGEAVFGHATVPRLLSERRGLDGMIEEIADRLPQSADVAGWNDHAAAIQDLGNHRNPGGHDGTPERHGVEELRGCLALRVAAVSLGHRDHVGGSEVAWHVLERDTPKEPHVGVARLQRATGVACRIRSDQRHGHVLTVEAGYRSAQILHALVGARRSQEHHEATVRRVEPAPRLSRVGASRLPGFGIPDVRNQRAAEPLLEKARCDGDAVGRAPKSLHQQL